MTHSGARLYNAWKALLPQTYVCIEYLTALGTDCWPTLALKAQKRTLGARTGTGLSGIHNQCAKITVPFQMPRTSLLWSHATVKRCLLHFHAHRMCVSELFLIYKRISESCCCVQHACGEQFVYAWIRESWMWLQSDTLLSRLIKLLSVIVDIQNDTQFRVTKNATAIIWDFSQVLVNSNVCEWKQLIDKTLSLIKATITLCLGARACWFCVWPFRVRLWQKYSLCWPPSWACNLTMHIFFFKFMILPLFKHWRKHTFTLFLIFFFAPFFSAFSCWSFFLFFLAFLDTAFFPLCWFLSIYVLLFRVLPFSSSTHLAFSVFHACAHTRMCSHTHVLTRAVHAKLKSMCTHAHTKKPFPNFSSKKQRAEKVSNRSNCLFPNKQSCSNALPGCFWKCFSRFCGKSRFSTVLGLSLPKQTILEGGWCLI